jgi:hypothetical protein
VHNQTLTVELIDSLQDRVDEAEHARKVALEELKLAKLKQAAAEEKQKEGEEYERKAAEALQTFCTAMEEEVFPPLIEGENFLRDHLGVDVTKFKAVIESRIRDGVTAQAEVQQRLEASEASRMAAEEKLQAQNVQLSEVAADADAERARLQEAEDQLRAKNDELAQLKAKTSEVQQELNKQKSASSKLAEELNQSKKSLEEVQKKLADAEALLKTRIYTQEEYEMGFTNGLRVCRRLCLHAEPNLDWSKCAEWIQNSEDPHMKFPTPAEAEILAAEEAEEEAERELEEREAQQGARPASSAAGAEASIADQSDSQAEA